MVNPFKVAFPLVTMPAQYGGREAIVVMSMAKQGEPNVLFCLCIDRSGRVHSGVPFSRLEVVLGASPDRRGRFVQVSAQEYEAPMVALATRE